MKKIKITEDQHRKMMEGLVQASKINGYIEKGDHSTLVHHYHKADDAGKEAILSAVKSHEKGGEVVANRILARHRDYKKTLEETNGVVDGIKNANDERITDLVEDTVDAGFTPTDMSDGKPMPNLKAKPVSEGTGISGDVGEDADDSGGMDEMVDTGEEAMDEDNFTNDVPLEETTVTAGSNGSYSSKYFIAGPGKEKDHLQYPGGKVVHVNAATHDQGVNSFTTKRAMKETIFNQTISEQTKVAVNTLKEEFSSLPDTLEGGDLDEMAAIHPRDRKLVRGQVRIPQNIIKKVKELQELIPQCIDRHGEKLGVIDNSSTWEEEYVYEVGIKGNRVIIDGKSAQRADTGHPEIYDFNRDWQNEHFWVYDECMSNLNTLLRLYKKTIKQVQMQTGDHKLGPNNMKNDAGEQDYWDNQKNGEGEVDENFDEFSDDSFDDRLFDDEHEMTDRGRFLYDILRKIYGKNGQITNDDVYNVSKKYEFPYKEVDIMASFALEGGLDEEAKGMYFPKLKPHDNLTARHDDFSHYTVFKGHKSVKEDVPADMTTMDNQQDDDSPMNGEVTGSPDEQPQFTTNDLIEVLHGVIDDCGEDHPVANHLMMILMHQGNPDSPDSPVSPDVVKAFREALPEPEGEDNTSSPDSPENAPQGTPQAPIEKPEGEEQPQEITEDDMGGEYHEKEDLTTVLEKIFQRYHRFSNYNIHAVANYLDIDPEVVKQAIAQLYPETNDVQNHVTLNQKYGIQEPFNANEAAIDEYDDYYPDDAQEWDELTSHPLPHREPEVQPDRGRGNYYGGHEDDIEETTGAMGSSGQYSAPLMRRPNTAADYVFEDGLDGGTDSVDWKFVESNLADFTDAEGLLRRTFGDENVHIEKESHAGSVAYVRDSNGDEFKIGLLKDGRFFVKMNDDNYDKYNVFGGLQDIIEAIKSFESDGSDEGEQEMNIQEEYNKPSTAMSFLKKVHAATKDITDAEMKKAGEVVKKGEETAGVQFTGKVEDTPQIKDEKEDGQIFDETTVQDEIDMIPDGMEDLKYANKQSPIFKKNFENGLAPVIKSKAVEDQHGNKYPEADHANVIDSGLGKKLKSDVEKKKAAAEKEPEAGNFIERTKIVKESDEIVITAEEQDKINEDIAKMKKLLGYTPKTYVSTKGNRTDDSLFRSKK